MNISSVSNYGNLNVSSHTSVAKQEERQGAKELAASPRRGDSVTISNERKGSTGKTKELSFDELKKLSEQQTSSFKNRQAGMSAPGNRDIVQEIMDTTRNNILNQSAQALLAQANQTPLNILQLLQ